MWRGMWDDSKDTLMKSDAPFPGLRVAPPVAPQAVPLSQVLEAMPKAASARVRPMAMAQGLAQAPAAPRPQGVPVQQRSLLCLDHFHIGSTNLLGDMLGGSLFLIAFNGPNKNSKEHRASPAYFQQPHAQCLRRVRQLFFQAPAPVLLGHTTWVQDNRVYLKRWVGRVRELWIYAILLSECSRTRFGFNMSRFHVVHHAHRIRVAQMYRKRWKLCSKAASPSIHCLREMMARIDWPALGLDRSFEPFGTFGTLQLPTFFLRSMSKSVMCEIKAVFLHSNHHNHLQFLQKPSLFKMKHCETLRKPKIQLFLLIFLYFPTKKYGDFWKDSHSHGIKPWRLRSQAWLQLCRG